MKTALSVLRNENGMMLIWFYMLIFILLVGGGSLYATAFQEARLINIDLSRDKAFYLAEAGLDQKLQELRTGNLANITGTGFGEGVFSVTYCSPDTTPCAPDPTLRRITSTGTVGGVTKTVTAVVSKATPAGVRAAISALWDVTVNGSITVDGRDHDSDGNLNGQTGTYGISSGGSVTQSGSADIGGNGIAPENPADPLTIEENATNNVFNTPEEVLGLAPGSLDSYKTSIPPTPPLNGIHYVTSDWIAPDFGDEDNPSTGVLIVHNDQSDALLKNVHGYFKGIIIADDLVHINGDAEIIGAAVLQKATGNSIGNGSAHIKYSLDILSNLPTANYNVVSWEDSQNA